MPGRPKKAITVPRIDARAVGKRIAAARKRRFATQADLARAIGASAGAVGAWETGNRVPRPQGLLALTIALRRTIDFLLLGRSGRPKKQEGNRGRRARACVIQPGQAAPPAIFE